MPFTSPFFSSLLHLLTHSFTFQCSNVISYTEETYISLNPAMRELLRNEMNYECINTVGYFIVNVGQATLKELHICISGASSLVCNLSLQLIQFFWSRTTCFLRSSTNYFFLSNSCIFPFCPPKNLGENSVPGFNSKSWGQSSPVLSL